LFASIGIAHQLCRSAYQFFQTVNRSGKITADSLRYEANDDTFKNDDDSNWRFRYKPTTNTITADSNAIKSSQQNDVKKYISNIDNMRANIKETGESSRDFLPLWMRTAQEGSLSELDYVLALPLVYTKPGFSSIIKNNIVNSGFDFSLLNFEVDRYIVDSTTGSSTEQYILFANYQFNV
jgi:hypothetical protein